MSFTLLLVPCLRRTVSLEEEYDAAGAEVVLDDGEDGEGWLATHGVQGLCLIAARFCTG
jgi:hypothetical protein